MFSDAISGWVVLLGVVGVVVVVWIIAKGER